MITLLLLQPSFVAPGSMALLYPTVISVNRPTPGDNREDVHIAQAAAQALTAVEHARSLFTSLPVPATATGPELESAAQSIRTIGQRTAVLSGVLADRHRTFTGTEARAFSDYARTDIVLQQHLVSRI